MDEWNINTVLSMIKFIYLGRIELINDEISDDEIADDNDENTTQGLDVDDEQVISEEVKCEIEEEESIVASSSDTDISVGSKSINNDDDDNNKNVKQFDNDSDEKENEMIALELECPESARALFALFQIAEFYEIKELSIACCHKLISYITPQTCSLF